MFRKLVSLLIALSFLLIGAAAFTAEVVKPGATQQVAPVQPKVPTFVCPPGWHSKGAGWPYACVPSKPAPIKCPEIPGKVFVYYEALTCTSTPTFGGTTCSGCEVGCRDATPPK